MGAPPSPGERKGGCSAALQVLRFCCCCFRKGEKSTKNKVKIKPKGLVGLHCPSCATAPAWVGVCSQIRPIRGGFGSGLGITVHGEALRGARVPGPPGPWHCQGLLRGVTPGVASWRWAPGGLVAYGRLIQVLGSCPVLDKEEDV